MKGVGSSVRTAVVRVSARAARAGVGALGVARRGAGRREWRVGQRSAPRCGPRTRAAPPLTTRPGSPGPLTQRLLIIFLNMNDLLT